MTQPNRHAYVGMDASEWETVRSLPVCRLLVVPRRRIAEEGSDRDDWWDQRLAALVSAYHAGSGGSGGAVLVGWRRAQAYGPTEVLIGGQALLTESDGGNVMLSLPAGGHGRLLPPGVAVDAFGTLPHWVRIGAITDGLLTDLAVNGPVEQTRPSLEDGLLAVWTQPFAWLLLAEPVPATEAGRLADGLADRQQRAQSMADLSPENTVYAARLEHRHREVRQATTSGLWCVHLLAGGATPQAAARVAGLLCASADLRQLPYALVPDSGSASDGSTGTGPSDHRIPKNTPGEDEPAYPFHASSQLVAALARPPVQEVAGVRFAMRPEFDITPEPSSQLAAGVILGAVLDRNRREVGPLSLPLSSLNRHTFVCGATGAGKSQTVRSLLTSATHANLPWLVVEPAKAEYRLMAARLPAAQVIAVRPGDPDAIAAGINPLEPGFGPDGRAFPLQTHADLVRALFLAAFEAEEPFPQVLAAALTRCYEQLGWDLALGEPAVPGTSPRYPTLADLQAAAEQVVDEIGYGKEITDNVRGFIRVRLSSLRLGTTGRFFEGGHPIDFGQLLSRNVVLEIEDVGDDRDKAFLMGTVLVRLVEYLRLRQRDEERHGQRRDGLRHLSVFEEAHRLLRRSDKAGPAAHAVETFAGLLAEIRAYGEGLIVAEQIPSKLVADVIKNTAVKIVHRLPAQDDRDAVGATMNITDAQSQFLVTLTPGEGAVFTDGMDYPHLVRMPDQTRTEATPGSVDIPASLVTPRSITCGGDCQQSPCTLRDMRAAQRMLAEEPQLVLWAELSTAAHLTGWGAPIPRARLLKRWASTPSRLRDCVISHVADAAVASRSTVIPATSSPATFSAHLAALLRDRLRGKAACQGEEHEYLAPSYRWCLVLEELQTAHEQDPSAPRHPRSDEWAGSYGRTIPGNSLIQQLQHVRTWWQRDQRDAAARRVVLWGSRPSSAIEAAVGIRQDDDDWSQRLGEAVEELSNTDGLITSYLGAEAPDQDSDSGED